MKNYCIIEVPDKGLLTFLYEEQIISVEDTITSLTAQELINAIREAEECVIGELHTKIATADGKTSLGSGVQTGITVILLEGWVIYSTLSSGRFTLEGGNVVRHDATTPFEPNTNITYTQVLVQGAVIATPTVTTAVASDIANAVWNTELTAQSWSASSFGTWVKGLLSKLFYTAYE
jgi:hypothetical protein